MCADNDLSTDLAGLVYLFNEFGQLTHDLAVQRKLRFFHQQEAVTLKQGPEQGEESQRPIGELGLALMSRVRSPMFKQANEMWDSVTIALDTEILQLGCGNF